MDLIPWIAAVAMMVLSFGLLCLAAILTFLTLLPHFSKGFQAAVSSAWDKLRDYIMDTARTYFDRIKWYGHTKPSTRIAVVFSLVIWFAVAASLTFAAYWRISIVVLITLPAVFLLAAWWKGGPGASNHRFRFVCSFFEPALALVVPSVGSKLIDIGLQALKAAL